MGGTDPSSVLAIIDAIIKKPFIFSHTSNKHTDFPFFYYLHSFPTMEQMCLNHNSVHSEVTYLC